MIAQTATIGLVESDWMHVHSNEQVTPEADDGYSPVCGHSNFGVRGEVENLHADCQTCVKTVRIQNAGQHVARLHC